LQPIDVVDPLRTTGCSRLVANDDAYGLRPRSVTTFRGSWISRWSTLLTEPYVHKAHGQRLADMRGPEATVAIDQAQAL